MTGEKGTVWMGGFDPIRTTSASRSPLHEQSCQLPTCIHFALCLVPEPLLVYPYHSLTALRRERPEPHRLRVEQSIGSSKAPSILSSAI